MTHKRTFQVTSSAAALAVMLVAGCATVTPVELTNARTAYGRAAAGPANQYTPADLHKAKVALDNAEASFADEKGSQRTIDLAYIAERSAETAEALAAGAIATKATADANQAYGLEQGAIVKQTQGDLSKTREQLGQAEQARAKQEEQTTAERSARQDAEQRASASDQKAKESDDALAKLAAKDEERGMVITLSGSVLFRTNDSALMPAAQERLNQVADALVAKGRSVVVEGYTDSRGSQSANLVLSQKRAESVRSYLTSHGVPQDKITAQGMGSDRPLSDNSNPEGRANNRRVEIVIAKNSTAK